MQGFCVPLGFVHHFPQDQDDFDVRSLEVVVEAAQLGRMAAALHSIEFAHKKQVYVALAEVICQ